MSREFKVGDRVISNRGHGIIKMIQEGEQYPIEVETADGRVLYFTADGKENAFDIYPVLYLLNEKPKNWKLPKEKVEVALWANVYDGYIKTYETELLAKENCDTSAIVVAVKLIGSYETEHEWLNEPLA